MSQYSLREAAKAYEAWLVAFLLALLAARLIANSFAVTGLVPNEAQYWFWSRDLELGYFTKPPLLAWLIRGISELCGQGEACLRSFPPVLLAIAAWFVFLTGRALYGTPIAVWSAVVFATLPLTAFLVTAITTDVPLLLVWSIALYLWTMLIERKSMAWALSLGLIIGVGLLAKYAMIYFTLCMAIQAMVSVEAREALRNRRGLVIVLVALVLIAPNLYWNYAHDFISFSQTAKSAGWYRQIVTPPQLLQFLLSQFLVYGPILFFMLMWIAAVAIRRGTDRRVVMLLSFSLPIIILMTVQALVSRAHANWTIAAAPAAAILVTAWLLERRRKIIFGATAATNVLATAAMLIGPVLPSDAFPVRLDPFARMRGWENVGAAVHRKLATNDYRALAVDSRALAAELLYHRRNSKVPLFAIGGCDAPDNTFEMTRPYRAGTPEPVLFLSLNPRQSAASEALSQFTSVTYLGAEAILGDGPKGRTLRFYRLSGFSGPRCRAQ